MPQESSSGGLEELKAFFLLEFTKTHQRLDLIESEPLSFGERMKKISDDINLIRQSQANISSQL